MSEFTYKATNEEKRLCHFEGGIIQYKEKKDKGARATYVDAKTGATNESQNRIMRNNMKEREKRCSQSAEKQQQMPNRDHPFNNTTKYRSFAVS